MNIFLKDVHLKGFILNYWRRMSKEKIKKLVVERDEIDKQLTVLQEVLKSVSLFCN